MHNQRTLSINAFASKLTLTKFFIIALVFSAVSACNSEQKAQVQTSAVVTNSVEVKTEAAVDAKAEPKTLEQVNMELKENNTITLIGQIRYQNFEGGFYGFIANNGDKYMPSGLPPEHRKNGLVVEIQAQPITGLVTTQQFGKVIKIVDIKVIDTSKVEDENETW